MPSPETRAITEVEASSPAPAPTTETEQEPESGPEKSKEYDPTAEQVTKTWEVLGLMDDQLPGEDPKLEFIASLSGDQKRYFEAIKRQKAAYEAKKNPAGQKKLARIFVLRKLVLGHDERAAETVEQAYRYLNNRINRAAGKLRTLSALRQRTRSIQQSIDRQQRSLRWLSEQRQNMEWIMASGYPKLWEKIRPPVHAQEQEPNEPSDELTDEDIKDLILEINPEADKAQSNEQGPTTKTEPATVEKPEPTDQLFNPETAGPLPAKPEFLNQEFWELIYKTGINYTEYSVANRDPKKEAETAGFFYVDPVNPYLSPELKKLTLETDAALAQLDQDYEAATDPYEKRAIQKQKDNLLKASTWSDSLKAVQIELERIIEEKREQNTGRPSGGEKSMLSRFVKPKEIFYPRPDESEPILRHLKQSYPDHAIAIYARSETGSPIVMNISKTEGKIGMIENVPTNRRPDYGPETKLMALMGGKISPRELKQLKSSR